jgi:hypothetical protein
MRRVSGQVPPRTQCGVGSWVDRPFETEHFGEMDVLTGHRSVDVPTRHRNVMAPHAFSAADRRFWRWSPIATPSPIRRKPTGTYIEWRCRPRSKAPSR